MIDRRQLIFGGACFLSAGAAEALRPRKRLVLLQSSELKEIVPRAFADWREIDLGGVVQQANEGDLASRLYSQLLARVYKRQSTGEIAMLAIAYGDTQSDMLQLHRPESCYPAFGFSLSEFQPTLVDLAGGGRIPCRSMVAHAPGRLESVTYWTRIGEHLPTTSSEQRMDKLRMAWAGFVPDGMLVRCSTVGEDLHRNLVTNSDFLSSLMLAIAPEHRSAFIGTALARTVTKSA